MFENLDRAYKHFMVLIPTTIGIIFLVLVVAYGSFRAALILLLPIPFAFASGAVALYLRHMNLNVSTGVGFATLFGIAIMDGVLMFKGISKYRLEGASVDDAIIHGRIDRLRPGLITSLVAILGLLPAALATGLGSDVQRPLATVIICGLSGSALFTLFITPVFYRICVPPLPESRPAPGVPPGLVEPLPDVSAVEVIELLEYLHRRGGQEDMIRIADDTGREFARVVYIVKAAEMLGVAETPLNMVALTAGRKTPCRGDAGRAQDLMARAAAHASPLPRSLRAAPTAARPRRGFGLRPGNDRHVDAPRELRASLPHLHSLGAVSAGCSSMTRPPSGSPCPK